MSSPTRAVLGLGNPGDQYANTRHNFGWWVLDAFAKRIGREAWKVKPKLYAQVTQAGDVLLAKPDTFMNSSGSSAIAISKFYKLAPGQMLVVSDDFNLPLGTVRFRQSGTSGGQKGLEDILRRLGTTHIPRLRVGIGSPVGDPTKYVLQPFKQEEQAHLADVLDQASEVIEQWINGELDE